jgi:16S rRNA (adenine1518-N6/adenine1519-N6)-dimethyltransferase
VLSIPRTAFFPVPEVDSALIRFDLLTGPRVSVRVPGRLFAVIRAAFGTRRKTLRNALCRGGWPGVSVDTALGAAGIEGRRRGETLTLEEFARLTEALPTTMDRDAVGEAGSDREAGSSLDVTAG